MKASIEDVARQAGVSTATVSRAFSRPDMVSAKTRAKVMEAAQQLDFSVSRMAGILKSGRSHRVALLVGSSKLDWFTSRIIEGLNEVLRSAGYDLVIQPIGDAGAREEFFDELPVRGNADAVIVSSFAITPAEIRRLNTTRIPLIGINTASQGFTASVGIDDKAGIRLIVRHLTTLGHRNLLYLYETFDATMGFSSHNRVTGFLEACSELDGVTGQTMDMQAGDDPVDAASPRCSRATTPDCLCFHQDSLAIPLFFRLRQCGMAIPTDLSVTRIRQQHVLGRGGADHRAPEAVRHGRRRRAQGPGPYRGAHPGPAARDLPPCNCWYATPPPRRGCAAERGRISRYSGRCCRTGLCRSCELSP